MKIAFRPRPVTHSGGGVRPRRTGGLAIALAAAAAMLGGGLAPGGTIEAAVVPWMSLEEMTGAAEIIALGRVESVEGARSDDGRIIISRVTIAVERAIKGGPRTRVTLEVPGGKADGRIMIASGAPAFASGERVVVFLAAAGEGGPPGAAPRLAVVGWNQGRLTVRRDPRTGRDLVHGRTEGTSYLDRQGKPVPPGRLDGGPVELEQFLAAVERLARAGAGGSRP
jgi:hypothetical protein